MKISNLEELETYFAADATVPTGSDSKPLGIAYTRVSTREQAETNHSLETQKREVLTYAVRNDVDIIEWFGGTFESAKSDERKEFEKLKKFAVNRNKNRKLPPISYLLVASHDRFSRTGGEAIQLAQELRKIGIRIIAVRNPTDTSTPIGQFLEGLELLQAKLVNATRTQSTVLGMREALLKGLWPTKPPLGYSKMEGETGKKICKLNKQGLLLKEAFRMKLYDDRTNSDIQQYLRSRGMMLLRQKLTEIFKNPFYAGLLKHGVLPNRIVPGKHEAIITQEEYMRLLGINSSFLKSNHKKDQDEFPLKSTVFCDKCGTALTGYKVKMKKAMYYKCNKAGCGVNVNSQKSHELFVSELKKYIISPLLLGPLKA